MEDTLNIPILGQSSWQLLEEKSLAKLALIDMINPLLTYSFSFLKKFGAEGVERGEKPHKSIEMINSKRGSKSYNTIEYTNSNTKPNTTRS